MPTPYQTSRGRVLTDSAGAEITATNPMPVSAVASSGAATATSRILSAAASTNATVVKASAGTVRMVSGYNARATAVFLKFYNKATAPTVGTDTPRKTIILQPLSYFVFDSLDYYATGIGLAMTTAAADADTGALTAADVLCLNVDYV